MNYAFSGAIDGPTMLLLGAQDLECIVWARNLSALALSMNEPQDRAAPATARIMVNVADKVLGDLLQRKYPDAELMRAFLQAAWGLMDLAELWQTRPALMVAAQQHYALVTPDATLQEQLTLRLAQVIDDEMGEAQSKGFRA